MSEPPSLSYQAVSSPLVYADDPSDTSAPPYILSLVAGPALSPSGTVSPGFNDAAFSVFDVLEVFVFVAVLSSSFLSLPHAVSYRISAIMMINTMLFLIFIFMVNLLT